MLGISTTLRRYYASNNSDAVYVNTFEFSHALLSPSIYVCSDNIQRQFRLVAGGDLVTFQPRSFSYKAGDNRGSTIVNANLIMTNADHLFNESVIDISKTSTPLQITERVYLGADGSLPQAEGVTLPVNNIEIYGASIRFVAGYAYLERRDLTNLVYSEDVFPILSNLQ